MTVAFVPVLNDLYITPCSTRGISHGFNKIKRGKKGIVAVCAFLLFSQDITSDRLFSEHHRSIFKKGNISSKEKKDPPSRVIVKIGTVVPRWKAVTLSLNSGKNLVSNCDNLSVSRFLTTSKHIQNYISGSVLDICIHF